MGRVQAVCRMQHAAHALGHKRGSDDQRHHQRDLHHRERAAHPLCPRSASGGARSGLELLNEVYAQRFEGGREPGGGGQNHLCQRENQSAPIERGVVPSGPVARHSRRHRDEDDVKIQLREEDAAGCACQRQQEFSVSS